MKIVFTHCTQSYPIKFSASNIKAEFVSRGLIEQGAQVTILGDTFGDKSLKEDISGVQNCIKYIVYSRPKRSIRVLIRNLWKCLCDLQKERVKGRRNIIFMGGVFPIFIIQTIWAKILGYKVVFLTQEWEPALNPKGLIEKIGCNLSVNWYGKWMDAILPISHFLWLKSEKFGKPMHITPILADFKDGPSCVVQLSYNHFAYCAGAAYFRVIQMVMDAYTIFVKSGGKQKMVLVISGRDADIAMVREYVESKGLGDKVIFKTQIPYSELMEIYNTALGLLIPLDSESLQDQARFSQKIAEYLSTGRPIITSNVGEVPYYFTAEKDVVIADYSVESYANAMMSLANDVTKSNQIGMEGFNTGKRCFDYRVNGKALYEFFDNL